MARASFFSTVSLLLFLVPSPANADEATKPEVTPRPDVPFQFGLRAGAAVPAGAVSRASSMGDYVASQGALLVEANAKVLPQLFVGAYGVYARGGVSDAFEGRSCRERNCSAQRFHFGAQVQYHPRAERPVSPWVGYGLGYEFLSSDGYPSTTVRGFEFARLMVGLDFRPSTAFGFGPFIDATLGGYTHSTTEQAMRGPQPYTVDRDDDLTMRLHSWITLGVRAVLFP